MIGRGNTCVGVKQKRMFFNKNFLAAWLIACISIAIGQTYPSLKKALACGTFISILEGSLKSQAVSFAIPVAAVLPWSDSILQEYKSGFLKGDTSQNDSQTVYRR